MKGSEVFRAFLNESVSFTPDYEKIKPRVFVKPLKTSEATDRKRRGLSFYLKYAVSSVLICSLLCCCLYIAYDDRFPKYTGDPALLSFGLTDVRYISKDSDKVTIDLGKLLNPKRIKVMQVSLGTLFSSVAPKITTNKSLMTPITDFINQKFIFEINDDETNRLHELIKKYQIINPNICLYFLNYEGELIQVSIFDNVTHFHYNPGAWNPNATSNLPKIKGLYISTKDFEYVCKDIDSIDLYNFYSLFCSKYIYNEKWDYSHNYLVWH